MKWLIVVALGYLVALPVVGIAFAVAGPIGAALATLLAVVLIPVAARGHVGSS